LRDSKKLRKELERFLTAERVVIQSEIPAKYRFDALRPYRPYPKLRKRGYPATILVRPETEGEVSDVVRVARRYRSPVVTYGGGTGLMGAAIAVHGGIMIDTSRMNRIEEISREDMMLRAEAGVVLEDAYHKLDEEQLLFAHDPWTRPIATIGGAISTNSLGYLGAKYGTIGTQLLGVEAVLPNGQLLKTRPAQFSSTGFDLRRLFIGTEGLFGIVTSSVVRSFPKPDTMQLVSYGFSSFEKAHRAICLMRQSDVRPSMVDYGEEPGADADSQLNLEFDGLEKEVLAQVEKAEQVIAECGGNKLGDADAREFWDHRHDIALVYSRRISNSAQKEEPRTKYDYIHVSLPASTILAFRKALLQIARDGGVNVLEVGLWQGPELLSLVLSARAADPRVATRKLWRVSNLIIRHAQGLGGAMEFCHGVGMKLAHLMEREHGVGLEVMRQLKNAVDPLGIMNPGKESI
jgi:FAD/FMN-containing dehydrogenase